MNTEQFFALMEQNRKTMNEFKQFDIQLRNAVLQSKQFNKDALKRLSESKKVLNSDVWLLRS